MPKGVYPRPPPLAAIRRGGSVYIPLNGKNGRGLFAIVSRRDFKLVASFRWHVSYTKAHTLYAQAHIRRLAGRSTTIQMHRLIIPNAEEVDHRDGNGLNNRRRNLRDASKTGNRRNRFIQHNNSSGYKGVAPFKGSKSTPWMATIGKGKNEYIGLFRTPEAAARAYDRRARQQFGRFARLNFPRRGERGIRRSKSPSIS